MSPPCHAFAAEELSDKVQEDLKGKRRKLPDGVKRIDLSACELLEMPQYKCDVEQPVTAESLIICDEVVRFFRRCKDRKGPFMIETTAWEGRRFPNSGSASNMGNDSSKSSSARPYQWSSSWVDGDSRSPS